MALLVVVVQVLYVLLLLCVACELGQRVTDIFDSVADVIEQFGWYSHPVTMRRMFLTILPFVQKPIDIKCFGSFAANRDNLKKVRLITGMLLSYWVDNVGRWMLAKFDFIRLNLYLNCFSFQIVNGGFSYFTVLRNFTH